MTRLAAMPPMMMARVFTTDSPFLVGLESSSLERAARPRCGRAHTLALVDAAIGDSLASDGIVDVGSALPHNRRRRLADPRISTKRSTSEGSRPVPRIARSSSTHRSTGNADCTGARAAIIARRQAKDTNFRRADDIPRTKYPAAHLAQSPVDERYRVEPRQLRRR